MVYDGLQVFHHRNGKEISRKTLSFSSRIVPSQNFGEQKNGSLSDKHIDSTDQNEDLVWEVGGTCYSKFVEMGIYISWRVTLKARINT